MTMSPKSLIQSAVPDVDIDPIIKKYRYRDEDLHDLTKARVILCEALNGPPPFDADACCTVTAACGGADCWNPEHLIWVLLSNSAAGSTVRRSRG
jgi:hypothetical protein